MTLRQILYRFLEIFPWSKRTFSMDDELFLSIQSLAEREGRPGDEVAAHLLSLALAEWFRAEDNLARWQTLTRREQQVTAMVCMDYSSRQIADQLGLSPDTVRSHLRGSLLKFHVRNKTELRLLLAGSSGWDFQAWEAAGFDPRRAGLPLTKLTGRPDSNQSNII